MYYMLLLVALAGCAHAAVPEYLDALSNYKVSVKELQNHLNFKEPNQTQVNYMVLNAAVTLLAYVKDPRTYDLLTDVATVLATSFPKQVLDLARLRYKRAESKSAKLRHVVQELCLPQGLKESANPAACDPEVDAEVKKNPELQKECPLLFALNDVCVAYYNLRHELNNAANSAESVQAYFKTGKVKLVNLARLAAKLYKLADLA